MQIEEDIDGKLDDTYMYRNREANNLDQREIDISTTYFKLLDVIAGCNYNGCRMYEFGIKHFPGYEPEHGYMAMSKSVVVQNPFLRIIKSY